MTTLFNPGAGVLNFHVKDPDATIYVGALDSQADEHILWELFIRCAPIVNVYIPRDKVHRTHPGYAFIEFKLARDADYACKVMHNVKLYGKPMRVNKADKDQKRDGMEWLVKLYIGNLSPDVDETILHNIFGRFGPVLSCHLASDPETQQRLGYAFLIYPTFESGDAAISALNGQYICGQQINVDYALIKGSDGERHGSQAERLLAEKAQENNLVPHEHVNIATLEHVGTNVSTSAGSSSDSYVPSSTSSALTHHHHSGRPPPVSLSTLTGSDASMTTAGASGGDYATSHEHSDISSVPPPPPPTAPHPSIPMTSPYGYPGMSVDPMMPPPPPGISYATYYHSALQPQPPQHITQPYMYQQPNQSYYGYPPGFYQQQQHPPQHYQPHMYAPPPPPQQQQQQHPPPPSHEYYPPQ